MKKLSLILFSCIALIASGFAQSITYFTDVGKGGSWPVVVTKIGEVERPLGLRLKLDWSGFAGLDAKSRAVGGVCLTYKASLARNVSLDIGPALLLSGGRVSGRGFMAGVSARF